MKQNCLKYLFRYLLLFSILTGNIAFSIEFPAIHERIYDELGLIDADNKKQLINNLKSLEDTTNIQFVIAVFKSLQGYNIEEFSYQLGRKWEIGQKNINNGVILIISKKERSVRIEVGYGLEGKLTDAVCAQIINEKIIPYFKQGNYQAGINAAVSTILEILYNKDPFSKHDKYDVYEQVNKIIAKNNLFNEILLYIPYFIRFIIVVTFLYIVNLCAKKFLSKYEQTLQVYAKNSNIFLAGAIIILIVIVRTITVLLSKKNSTIDEDSSSREKEKSFGGGKGGSFGGGGASSRW